MKLESKMWNLEPTQIPSFYYDYQEKENFLREAGDVISEISRVYKRFQNYFTKQDRSPQKAIWMLHMDALATIDYCLDLLRQRKFRITAKLLRDIFECIDLATLFWLTRDNRKKYLDKWYRDKTVCHGEYRKHLDKELGKTYIAKNSKSLYQSLSEYTHHNYSALLDSYILARDNRIYFHDEKELPLLPQRVTEYAWILGKGIATLLYYADSIVKDEIIVNMKKEFKTKSFFKYCIVIP